MKTTQQKLTPRSGRTKQLKIFKFTSINLKFKLHQILISIYFQCFSIRIPEVEELFQYLQKLRLQC